jgi:hypothetical protein
MASYVFIDWRVGDVNSILDSLASDADITTVILDRDQDGLTQIAQALAGVTDLAAVHIISHGASGRLYLGGSVITSDTLANYASRLQTLGAALSATSDLLLYGCEVAQHVIGQTFIANLVRYTGADVAASTDYTGDEALNGDWNFEATTGAIEAQEIAVPGFAGVLAPAIDLTTIAAGTGGFAIYGEDAHDRSGDSVASAGDINGDGSDDLIIGARFDDAAHNAKSNAGDSYVPLLSMR